MGLNKDIKFVIFSILFHALLFLFLLADFNTRMPVDLPVVVDIISQPPSSKTLNLNDLKPVFNKSNIAEIPASAAPNQNSIDSTPEMPKFGTAPELLYDSFLRRIKTSIDPEWRSKVRELLKKNKITRLSNIKPTVVLMVINKNGEVVVVELLQSSGYKFLDDLAIEVIKNRTFPNPPKNLLDSDGFGRIRWTYRIFI